MTTIFLNGLLSCTFLYEWLLFLFEWSFVMHISVRMTTISFWMDFRHTRFCANDYHFFLNGFSSCSFLYEWPPFSCIWVFVMHVSVQMTFHILCIFIFVMHISVPMNLHILPVFLVCNALQRVNSMVQRRIINDIICI